MFTCNSIYYLLTIFLPKYFKEWSAAMLNRAKDA